jgi:hypothetical protein
MARFSAKLLRQEITREMKRLRARNDLLLKLLSTNDAQSAAARALLDGGWLIAARAKEIITEKGHIVTGNLRRSITAQIGATSDDRLEVEVGTWLFYAPFVEALPDGGYLFPASEEQFPNVVRLFAERGIQGVVVRWAA